MCNTNKQIKRQGKTVYLGVASYSCNLDLRAIITETCSELIWILCFGNENSTVYNPLLSKQTVCKVSNRVHYCSSNYKKLHCEKLPTTDMFLKCPN